MIISTTTTTSVTPSKAEALLSMMLGWEPDGLVQRLESVKYDWGEVLDQCDFPRPDLTQGVLMDGVMGVGILKIADAINGRVTELEAIQNERELDSEEVSELEALRYLNPDRDICYMDEYKVQLSMSRMYSRYVPEALNDFTKESGFIIIGA